MVPPNIMTIEGIMRIKSTCNPTFSWLNLQEYERNQIRKEAEAEYNTRETNEVKRIAKGEHQLQTRLIQNEETKKRNIHEFEKVISK